MERPTREIKCKGCGKTCTIWADTPEDNLMSSFCGTACKMQHERHTAYMARQHEWRRAAGLEN